MRNMRHILTEMRWRYDGRNIKIIGIKLLQPKFRPCSVVDEVVRAVIIFYLEEEFDIVGKHNMFLHNEVFDYPGPTANFSHYIRVVYVSLSNDARRRMSEEIKLPFRMDIWRPLGWKICGCGISGRDEHPRRDYGNIRLDPEKYRQEGRQLGRKPYREVSPYLVVCFDVV
jgi:hypothetical protein